LSIVDFLAAAAAATITDQEFALVHRSTAICEPMIETRVKYPVLLRDMSTLVSFPSTRSNISPGPDQQQMWWRIRPNGYIGRSIHKGLVVCSGLPRVQPTRV